MDKHDRAEELIEAQRVYVAFLRGSRGYATEFNTNVKVALVAYMLTEVLCVPVNLLTYHDRDGSLRVDQIYIKGHGYATYNIASYWSDWVIAMIAFTERAISEMIPASQWTLDGQENPFFAGEYVRAAAKRYFVHAVGYDGDDAEMIAHERVRELVMLARYRGEGRS